MRRSFVLILLLALFVHAADDPRPKSGIPEIDSLPLNDWSVKTTPLSVSKTVALSALLPGGGQFYSGHPVRGSFLLGLESVLFGLSLYAYYVDLPHLDRQTHRYLDSADAAFDYARLHPEASSNFEGWVTLARASASQRLKQADLANSELAWAIGLHFYGMGDALETALRSQPSRHREKSVQKALWCGLVFPGGGQLYNERYGKFGLLWMALGASAVSGWSRQNVVESLNLSVATARAENPGLEPTELTTDRTLYRKRRNQYYWGMALLYVYGIMDGMVDAALSDFDQPNRYALGPGDTPLSLAAYIHF